MRQQRLEARVLHLVDVVISGRRVEDDRVEFKSIWPADHRRAARQIAGLANAAGAEPILWIVGVDENAHKTTTPGNIEPADWWSMVSKWFAEVAPELSLLTVPTPHGTVIALEFDTGRAPYVVTTTGATEVHREIPWRTANSTRSAHRSEILRSLVGEAAVPHLECVGATLRIEQGPGRRSPRTAGDPGVVSAEFSMTAYVECTEPVRLPEHKWSLVLEIAGTSLNIKPRINGPVSPTTPSGDSSRLRPWTTPQYEPVGSISYVKSSGLHVNGSDSIDILGEAAWSDPDGAHADAARRAQLVRVSLRLPLALSARSAALDVPLRRTRKVPMSDLSGQMKYVDLRLGEFAFGTVSEQWTYHGHHKPPDQP